MFSFIPKFLGIILNFIYENLSFENYGFAIIIFTIFVKLLLLPLTVKQLKSSAKMQELQPLIQEVQRKYKNDKEKLNEEMMKVYTENKYNPASGCLPTFLQLPILFSLIYVIGKPLTYMLNFSSEKVTQIIEKTGVGKGFYNQLEAINKDPTIGLNMDFLGLDLGKIPTWVPNQLFGDEMMTYLPMLMIPLFSFVTAILSSKLMMMSTMKRNGNNKNSSGSQDSAMAMQKNMMYIAPVMTLFFAFKFPLGIALYFLVGNIFQIFQQLYVNNVVINKKEVEEK